MLPLPAAITQWLAELFLMTEWAAIPISTILTVVFSVLYDEKVACLRAPLLWAAEYCPATARHTTALDCCVGWPVVRV
jgi:hypothetical protein